ncbi:hypothetical protein SAMN05661010_02551 [Modicisalibacter muralis]|uniref:Uncharacterized protein n=1 Tax=Modicisalibacter muralis TaxID=119000 RepID=A0A1G9MWJ5_9GAMM|nr:hypothetical protein [Halomonas muralis]SDL78652.1 hypothetical protein SAMN05661010_02551 [Halomonas muralis]
MTTQKRLTSAQRFAIFQIVDRAIDVTQQGEWHASAEYAGASNLVQVTIRRAGGKITDPEGQVVNAFLARLGNESDDDNNNNRINAELGGLLDHLNGLLNKSGATS